jgi:hypothetical protein
MIKRKREGQTIQWLKEKEKDRQYNDQKKREGQTIQWSKENEKDRQYND